MPLIRTWSAQAQQGFATINVTFECPFFNELVAPHGMLNGDFEAHALWDYYGAALKAYMMAKNNFVYEDEPSRVFDRETAKQLFKNTANKHGVRPDKMVNYWPMIHSQRLLMKGSDHLPEEFQFRYWGV